MNINDIRIGQTYRSVDNLSPQVKVTRIWTDNKGTGIAFDVLGTD
ncbi:hypothetical protein ACH4UT_23715 [Streptomyces sp. NPDC020799]